MKLDAIQFLTNASIMLSMVFIPLLAEDLGASCMQTGIILSVYGLCLGASSYIFSKAADAWSIKRLLLTGLACSAAAYLLQAFADDPLTLGLARGLLGIAIGIYPAALIMHVYGMKRSVSKFISFCALGWAAGFIGAAFIGDYDLIFATSSALVAISFVIALTLPEVKVKRLNVSYLSLDTVRANWAVYVPFLMRHAGASAVWVIFPLYMTSLGADKFWIATIYAINPLMQFFMMRRLDGKDMVSVVKYGHLISAIAFLSFIPPTIFYYVPPGMVLVALSWSFLYVGSTELLLRRNEDKAASAGLITTVISLATVVGSLIGGAVSQYHGFVAALMVGAMMCFAGFLISAKYLTRTC
ncbi:MAG: arabinose efflux permease [Candidatus Methanogaster sp.]|uniref:Arabinose efflux permease n=1 Tax=Candidatus Methanogaster sp. TaxID=3386292 RepID=A0AC61KYM4_9EURY|nr:MAG: arabinose efflux permease [ANME-2 cluster archaeon]